MKDMHHAVHTYANYNVPSATGRAYITLLAQQTGGIVCKYQAALDYELISPITPCKVSCQNTNFLKSVKFSVLSTL